MNEVVIMEKIRFREVLSNWARRACWAVGGAMICWMLVLWFYIPWLRKVEVPKTQISRASIVEANGMTWRIWDDGRVDVVKFEGDEDKWTVRFETVENPCGSLQNSERAKHTTSGGQ